MADVQDKLRLKLVDTLTYPRPVRQFALLVDEGMALKDLRDLMALEVRWTRGCPSRA